MTELLTMLVTDMHKHKLTPAQRALAVDQAYKRTCVPDCVCKRPARRALAADMMPLVLRCAKQLTRNGAVLDAEFEDLVQAGALGLIQAIESYDPEHAGAAKLATWSSWYIKREMIRENARTPVVPHATSVESYFDADVEEAPDYTHSTQDDPATITEHENFSRWLTRARDQILTPLEYLVLEGVYFREVRMVVLANELGLTPSRISQLRTTALQKMRGMDFSPDA